MEWAGCWYVRLVFCKLCVAYIGQLAIGIVSAVVCGGCSLGWAWNVLKHKLHASPYAQSAMCSVWWLWVRLAMSCVNGKIETCTTCMFTARCFRELHKPEHHFIPVFMVFTYNAIASLHAKNLPHPKVWLYLHVYARARERTTMNIMPERPPAAGRCLHDQ